MIQLDNTIVLRFKYEEVMRLKEDHAHDDPLIDWFATYIYRQFPDKYILAKTHDPMSDYVWVILRDTYPVIESTVRYHEGTPYEEEKLIN